MSQESWLRTAQTLFGEGKAAESVPFFTKASDAGESRISYLALLGLSRAHTALGEQSCAEEAAKRAIATMPDDCTGYALLTLILMDDHRLDEAAHVAALALERGPHVAPLYNLAAGVALRQGRLTDAKHLIDGCLALNPTDRRALSYLPAVLAGLGRQHEAESRLDFDRLIKISAVVPPAGFTDPNEFNAAVAEAVAASEELRGGLIGKTLVGGDRLAALTSLPLDLAHGLRACFAALVTAFGEGVVAGGPAAFDIVSWASVMGAGAYELPHIHENGWLSGVYYPQMPALASEAPGAAAIVFGAHDIPGNTLPAGPTCSHLPSPGEILLFPSWLYHRTVPFQGAGQRISVAFDAQPRAARR